MRGDLDFDELSGRTRFTPRALDPRGPACPLHLRRICGTCAHFDGALRDAGPRRCTRFEVEVTAARPAAKCKSWGRK